MKIKSGGGQETKGAQPTWFQYLNPTSTLPETFWKRETAYQRLFARFPDMKLG